MQSKLKSVFSILAIGFFILFALASGGPDGSTNTTVAKNGNCAVLTAHTADILVDIIHKELNGTPIPGSTGTFFITIQRINDNTECKYQYDYFTRSFALNAEGQHSFSGLNFESLNKLDLVRVELLIRTSSTHTGYRETKTLYHPGRYFAFKAFSHRKDAL